MMRKVVLTGLAALFLEYSGYAGGEFLREQAAAWRSMPVKVWECKAFPAEPGVRAIMYEGIGGKRNFAWIGFPEGASKEKPVPGVVLVHGGGGTAFARWVRYWNRQGYAAIAPDNCGSLPVAFDPTGEVRFSWCRHRWSGPAGWNPWYELQHKTVKLENLWLTHAVASTIKAATVLSEYPQVDRERLGITGVSWGAVISGIVIGTDPRFKAAGLVYGCGFLSEYSRFCEQEKKLLPERRLLLREEFDPLNFLGDVRIPVLFFCGTNDPSFWPPSWQKSTDLVARAERCMKLRYPHAHGPVGEEMPELRGFFREHLEGGAPRLRLGKPERNGLSLSAAVGNGAPAGTELLVSCSSGEWKNKEWKRLPAVFDPAARRVKATLPEHWVAAFFSITAPDGQKVTSPILFPPAELPGTVRRESRSRLKVVKLPPNARLEGARLIVENPGQAGKGLYFAEFSLPVKEFAGCFLSGSIRGRSDGLQMAKNGRVFLQMSYPSADGRFRRFNLETRRNFRNGVLPFCIAVEPHAENCTLKLGILNASGRVEFDLDSLQFEPLFSRGKTDWKCEYSEEVKRRPRRRGVMSPIIDQTNEEHFRTLKKWNVNLMRLQLNTAEEWARNNPERYRKFIEEKINRVIPRVLELGGKYGIKIIIDLHMTPGSNRMTSEENGMYDSDTAVEEYLEIWRRIARKFGGHPALYGYDLMNEPHQIRKAKYNCRDLQRMAAEAIRSIDPETPIYVESNHMANPVDFFYLEPIRLKNIIYQLHFYDPIPYTHQKLFKAELNSGGKQPKTFPGEYFGSRWDDSLKEFRKSVAYVQEFERRYGAKIFVGEFSAQAYAPGAAEYLACCIRFFEECNWEWCYHAFREARMWDLEYSGSAIDDLKPDHDSDRKRILLEGFRLNQTESAAGK